MITKGMVFNIQHFTIHDGPGIRTEVFLKGCPLRCKWCGNPESQKFSIELGVYSSKCIGIEKCGDCLEACEEKEALHFENGFLKCIDRNKTEQCLPCVDVCPTEAIKQWGKEMTVEECMKEIRKDKGYYERSGGGVTVSGGDPLMQSEFVVKLFKACKEEGIHTCLESDFHSNWSKVKEILVYTDLVIADIKHMNSKIHMLKTGVGNELILDNMIKLSKYNIPLILRIPIIPAFNNNYKNMEQTADFILQKMNGNVRTLQLLSFMRLGEEKYTSLNLDYPMGDIELDRESFTEKVKGFVDYFKSRGIHCLAGTKEQD